MSFDNFKQWIKLGHEDKAHDWVQEHPLTDRHWTSLACMVLQQPKTEIDKMIELVHKITNVDGKVCRQWGSNLLGMMHALDRGYANTLNFLLRHKFVPPGLPPFDVVLEHLTDIIDSLLQLKTTRQAWEPMLELLRVIFPFWRDFYLPHAECIRQALLADVLLLPLAHGVISYLDDEDRRDLIPPLGLHAMDDWLYIASDVKSVYFTLGLMRETFSDRRQLGQFRHFLDTQWTWFDTDKVPETWNIIRHRGVAWGRKCTSKERFEWNALFFCCYDQEDLDLRAF